MVNPNNPLKVALHAMDTRSVKTMIMYLQGPCKNTALVVDEISAEVDIFDADTFNAKKLLNDYLAKPRLRPVIVLSLQDLDLKDVILVKKPVKAQQMIDALAQARNSLINKKNSSMTAGGKVATESTDELPRTEASPLKKYAINLDERKKTAKHQAAMQLSEGAFNAYIGNIPGVDVNDPKQFYKAGYQPKDYYQGMVHTAIKTSRETGQVMEVCVGWRQLILFPRSNEVWLDADDKQLRAFAGLKFEDYQNSTPAVVPINPDLAELSQTPERFHSFDVFVWKLACWTSKGRYPDTIDFDQPVYLKHWPNFTRLLITPHAMRIAALLVREPRTMKDTVDVLDIKPQYVFAFISAAYALGLVGQAKREPDRLVQPSELKSSPQKSLLGRIISKLRGSHV